MSASIREDREYLQQQFQTIGSRIVSMLPGPWRKAVFGFFLSGEENTTHYQLWYAPEGGGDYENLVKKVWDDDVFLNSLEALERMCLRLRAQCAAANDPWFEMTLVILGNGDFSVDFAYDPIPDFSSKYVMGWQSRCFD